MPKQLKPLSNRRPPVPSEGHGDVEHWITRVMPDLHPIVESLDAQIRERLPEVQSAVKWKRAFYGLPELGWLIELAAYDVSVNVVFFGGADFEAPPPLGESGRSRYVKVRSVEETQTAEMSAWIDAAGRTAGWR